VSCSLWRAAPRTVTVRSLGRISAGCGAVYGQDLGYLTRNTVPERLREQVLLGRAWQ
jgi:hypothetical protein